MFVLNPGGGGSSGSTSQFRTNAVFFAKLGLYFAAVRVAFVFLSVTMELTEEQKERSQRNRERALEIQKKRKESQNQESSGGESLLSSSGGSKRLKVEEAKDDDDGEKGVELEDFEVGASSLVSKKEAMHTYCLPEGTLAVCSFVEKENPRNKKWAPLKLYNRAEIRRRARARFGGLEGLVKERQRRELNRFRKDMETAKNVFQNKTK